jgi:DNA-binding CsgD family transcriptional regulator
MPLRFTHALVRDTLYEGLTRTRRHSWHRSVAEALTTEADAEPETIAHHFRQALDPRAADWFIRAGSRAERVAWLTAASHFEAALAMMGSGDATPNERGWLLMRRARLLRIAEPRTALALLDTAATLAEDASDAVLRAYVMFYRGQVYMLADEARAGFAELEASVAEFKRMSREDLMRVSDLERQGVFLSRSEIEGLLAGVFATGGRIDEALALTQAIIEQATDIPERAWWGRAIALALAGRISEAREAYAIARNAAERVSDTSGMVLMYLYQISNVVLPYGTDNLLERSRIAREGEAAWRRIGGALGDVSPRGAWLPILQIEGDWAEARALALSGIQSGSTTSEQDLVSITVLARLAWAQGDVARAWELIYAILRSGPHTIPGYTDLGHSMALMRIAAELCLDHNDLPAAHAWLDAHDRWLEWSGAVLGRADGQCAWASYWLAARDIGRARQHAEQALTLASEPRQPLALLAAHRLCGTIEAHDSRLLDAHQHLDAALALADACAAPYERALTLLACADLALRSGANDRAGLALDEARAICLPLAAVPTLARIDALAARLGDQSSAMARTASIGLSPREIEVLRLLASGRTNREIAETLFLSARTVERHITNLYAKIGAQGRAEAMAFARNLALV